MKKIPLKEQLEEANSTISHIFDDICTLISRGKALELMLADFENDLDRLDSDILDERDYIRENTTGAYRSNMSATRKYLKKLLKTRKEQVQLIKSFKQIIKQRNKIEKLLLSP